MRSSLIPLALLSACVLITLPVAAQTPPANTPPQPVETKKTAPSMTTEADRTKAKTATDKPRVGGRKTRRHAHGVRRHRTARHHRNRWRNVWVYKAHDRHGYRHYEYVRRKFGGYFARGRACGCRSDGRYFGRHGHL